LEALMIVWPEWMTRRIAEIVVLENPASILHLVAAIVLATLGCGRETFAAYTLYQVYTTIAKTIAFPEETLADWPTDLLGDTLEYAIGLGLAWALGLTGKVKLPEPYNKACTWKGVLAGLGLVTLVWLAFFIRDLLA